jgi:putative colanic acid biosynthesis UDP-glucose lipid carrier transferase
VLFSLALLFFVLPWLVPLLWVLTKLDSKGPLFFVQQREGKNGILFSCYKFRTLPTDAPAHVPGQALQTHVSRLGRILRNSGIDELPQALNILKGEMSVVGPRPHLAIDNSYFSKVVGAEAMHKRQTVLPGLTGWAQVKGHKGPALSDKNIRRRIQADLAYIDRQNLWLDIRIVTISFIMLVRAAVSKLLAKSTAMIYV